MSVVDENQLHPAHERCLICGDENFINAPIILLLQQQPVVSLKQCQRCFVSSADRMPVDSYLRDLYKPDLYQSALTDDDALSGKCATNIQRVFKKADTHNIEILDYGGGNGKLARILREKLIAQYGDSVQITATVVDIHPRDAESDLTFISVEEFLQSEKKYDILIASAVLEHIPHLQPILEKICSAGKQGALFYSRSPYDAPLARYVANYPIKWPRHVHDMGPDFWRALARRMPMQILESRTSIVESSLKTRPVQTLLAHILKFPSLIETKLINKLLKRDRVSWHFVGGWEVFIRLDAN